MGHQSILLVHRVRLGIAGALALLLLAGCGLLPGQPAPPAAAVLPTATPVPAATLPSTPLPPTWTPSPVPPASCSAAIAQTTRRAQEVCGATANGEACFVAPRITLGLREGGSVPAFSAPGDRLPQTLIHRITTAPYDAVTGTWGMAMLRTSERAEATPFDATTLLMYGDATLFDVGGGTPFRSVFVLTGFGDPWCDQGLLPGVLMQSGIAVTDTLLINTLQVRFRGTLLVRAPAQAWLEIAVLNGQAEITTADGGLIVQAGQQLFTLLGGATGFEPVGPPEIRPLSAENTAYLPLPALPRAVAVAAPAVPTIDRFNVPLASATPWPTFNIPVTMTPSPTPTPMVPFAGQVPPGGVFFTFEGKRIEPGQRLQSAVPAGGSDSWVFTPHGLGPDSFDSFDIIAAGDWDPVVIVESATFGIYEPEYDSREGQEETYRASLAGSGGDWKITVRDADGGGGAYTIRYRCLGPCPPVE